MRHGFIALKRHVLSIALAMLLANTAAVTSAAAREVLRSLIEIDTTAAHGTLAAAQAIADRLAKAGFAEARLIDAVARADRALSR